MLPAGIEKLDRTAAQRLGFRIHDWKVITPLANTLFFGRGNRTMKDALRVLDEGIQAGITARIEPGVRARVVAWNGANGWVAGYNNDGVNDGVQVGYGHITYNPRYRMPDLVGFDSEYVVGSRFQRLGLGYVMKELLETFAASTLELPIRGLGVISTIRAQPKHVAASVALLEKLGAVSIGSNRYRRILLNVASTNSNERPGIVVLKTSDISPQVNY